MEVLNINKYRRISNLLLFLFIGLALLPFLLEWIQGSSISLLICLIARYFRQSGFSNNNVLLCSQGSCGGSTCKEETIYMEAVVCAVILIAVKILVGSINGQLGESPYDLSPKGILGNLFYVLPL